MESAEQLEPTVPERLVEERDLNFAAFRCCGDEDLHPFRCPACGRVMVFCYECDTLYHDLNDLDQQDTPVNSFDPSAPIFACRACGYEFEYFFMRNERYAVPLNAWLGAGLGHLLREPLAHG
jgi:hypothetical protein